MPASWTALMIKKDKDLGYEALNNLMKLHIQEYKNKHFEAKFMELSYIY